MNWQLSQRAQGMTASFIREVLKVSERPGVISLAGGMPSPDTFPVTLIRDATDKVLSADSRGALQYSTTEGYRPLREAVANMLPWDVDPDLVLITTGAQQGLDLVARVLTNPGQKVLVETPSFLGALQAFQAMQSSPHSLACDDDGVLVDELSSQRDGAAFAYLLPTFQNPTGRTMPDARRQAVVECARDASLPIVEDNPYSELWYDNPPPLPLAARNPEGCLYLGSFSKVMVPAFRLGFLVAPAAVLGKFVQAKQAADVHSASFNQRIAAELLNAGFVAHHTPFIRELYRRRRDVLLRAVERHLVGMGVTYNTPSGGMFVWLRLAAGFDAEALFEKAVARNVTFVPGAAFFAQQPDRRSFRLSFATASDEQLEEAVARLADALRELQSARAPADESA